MASLTIRKLDEAIKAELRLRAARNGRSVEDEVRVILREASQNRPGFAATPSQAAPIAQDSPHRLQTARQSAIRPAPFDWHYRIEVNAASILTVNGEPDTGQKRKR